MKTVAVWDETDLVLSVKSRFVLFPLNEVPSGERTRNVTTRSINEYFYGLLYMQN